MFLQQIRRKAWIHRLRRKRQILYFSQPVNMNHQLEDIKKICICMPQDHKYFYEARACIQKIRQPKFQILLVLNRELELQAEHHGKTEIYPHLPSNPFPIQEKMINNIPKRFDIAIDLSPKPSPLTAYITGTRGKNLTIGLESDKLNSFYTVLVKPGNNYRESVITMLSLAGLL